MTDNRHKYAVELLKGFVSWVGSLFDISNRNYWLVESQVGDIYIVDKRTGESARYLIAKDHVRGEWP
jgi:hypothetical protein